MHEIFINILHPEKLMIKGQIVGGRFGEILIRQKAGEHIEIGELLVSETENSKIILQVYDIIYGSQISQQNLELVRATDPASAPVIASAGAVCSARPCCPRCRSGTQGSARDDFPPKRWPLAAQSAPVAYRGPTASASPHPRGGRPAPPLVQGRRRGNS